MQLFYPPSSFFVMANFPKASRVDKRRRAMRKLHSTTFSFFLSLELLLFLPIFSCLQDNINDAAAT